ncbi:MAG TPA: TonB family protein [Bryobacteraceae bacterium]|nr:TonB family protein [Bryobacteraceae bacterium]
MRIAEFSAQWEGRTIEGGFPLRQHLGAGESSSVFLTTYAERNAAVKLIPADPQTADAQLLRWREAAKLSHINLLRIFATGRCELDGMQLLYIVTERAEEDLSQVLPDRSLTAVEAREALEPTLSALDYIHRQGFVHAHIKPSNIMAVEDRLKISSDGLVRPNAAAATPPTPYDPPEKTLTPAADVWSLGVTLIEILTQRLPANGTVPSSLPEPFNEIANACLKRNPVDRATVPQIQNLLTPAPTPVVLRKRRYTPVGVLIILGLVVVTVAGVMIMHSDTGASGPVQATATKPPEPQAQPAPQPQEQPKQVAPKQVASAAPPKSEPTPEPANPSAPEPPMPSVTTPVSGIVAQPLPEIMDKARNSIHGRVRLTVRVDVAPSGTVTDAKLESAGASKYFGERALVAVRQWKFEPVSVNGSEVGQRWRVRFEFQKSGIKAQPQRLAP